MSVRHSFAIALGFSCSLVAACGGTTKEPVAKSAVTASAPNVAPLAPPPAPTVVPTAAPVEAQAGPIDPRKEPVLCHEQDHRCDLEVFDDATLARLALLPDREGYEFMLDDVTDARLETVKRAPFVHELRLQDGKLTSFSALAALPQLRELVVTSTEADDFSALGQLGALEQLSIFRTSIKKLPDAKAWTALTELHLEGNDQLTAFSGLSSLSKVRVLHLGSSKIASLAPLASLSTLEDLGIELTPLHTLKPLHGLKSLKHVLVSPDMPLFERAALKKAVPGVEVEAYAPKEGYVVNENGKCYVIVPGCCLCGEQSIPCAAKK